MPVRTSSAEWKGTLKDGAGPAIHLIELKTEAEIPGLSDDRFQALAEAAKKGCPVSKALAGPEVRLQATLLKS